MVWNASGKLRATLTGHEGEVWAVAVCPNNLFISLPSNYKMVLCWCGVPPPPRGVGARGNEAQGHRTRSNRTRGNEARGATGRVATERAVTRQRFHFVVIVVAIVHCSWAGSFTFRAGSLTEEFFLHNFQDNSLQDNFSYRTIFRGLLESRPLITVQLKV